MRIGGKNGSGSWEYSGWSDLSSGWNALEIEYLPGDETGQMSLWVNGAPEQTLNTLDNGTAQVDTIRLGAIGVETGRQRMRHALY